MGARTCRIKFYGYSGNDPDMFCRNLAALLNISSEQARTILTDVRDGPVVLAAGVEQKAAEKLQQLVQSKQGLCLLEPEQEEPEDATPAASGTWSSVPEQAETEVVEQRTPLVTKVVLIGLASLIAGFVIYTGSGFLSSVSNVRRHNPEAVKPIGPPEQAQDEEPQPSPARAALEARAALDERLRELEARLNALTVQLTMEEDYLRSQRAALMAGNPQFEQRKQNARDLRREIFLVNTELQLLKRRIEVSEGGSP
jgi:hypothetical protein